MQSSYKYIFGAALLGMALTACDDEENLRVAEMPASALQFTPTMGGAVLHYQLPDDNDVVGIHVRYKDAYGTEILRTGSSLCDSMVLVGFNEAVAAVPAEVTLQYFDRTESAPIPVTFSTLDSAPIQFINSVDIASGWDGFSMKFSCPVGSTGMAHVLYLGKNPHDPSRPDTVLMSSFALTPTEGTETIIYKNKQAVENTTVVVRAEDYRGYIVRQKVFENVASVNTAKLDPKKYEIFYANSLEIPEEKIGLQYLNDGDNRGLSWFEDEDDHIYHTFLSGKDGAGPDAVPMYVDLGELRPTAQLRLCALRDLGDGVCSERPCIGPKSWCLGRADGTQCETVQIFSGGYCNKLPSSVTVYGCRKAETSRDWDSMEWEQLGKFHQDADAEAEERWCYDALDCGGMYSVTTFRTLAKLQGGGSIYMPIDFAVDGQGEGFRYLKLVFNDVFRHPYLEDNGNYVNTRKYMSFHELEIYSRKETE